jgi:hypothetical protein
MAQQDSMQGERVRRKTNLRCRYCCQKMAGVGVGVRKKVPLLLAKIGRRWCEEEENPHSDLEARKKREEIETGVVATFIAGEDTADFHLPSIEKVGKKRDTHIQGNRA